MHSKANALNGNNAVSWWWCLPSCCAEGIPSTEETRRPRLTHTLTEETKRRTKPGDSIEYRRGLSGSFLMKRMQCSAVSIVGVTFDPPKALRGILDLHDCGGERHRRKKHRNSASLGVFRHHESRYHHHQQVWTQANDRPGIGRIEGFLHDAATWAVVFQPIRRSDPKAIGCVRKRTMCVSSYYMQQLLEASLVLDC